MKKLGFLLILLLFTSTITAYADENTVKTLDKINGYQAKIDKDKGHVDLSKDKSDKQLRIKLITTEIPLYSETDGKAKHDYATIRTETYLVPGGLEYMIILDKNPSTNQFHISVEGEGLQWYYQPPLTEEYELANETHAWDETGSILAYRPKNVVDSYAIYDGINKFSHVYRPLIYDSKDSQVWGSLNYDDGVLTVTVPQSFLDSAKYPVYVDPTFGYTTIGGSTDSLTVEDIPFSWWTYSGLSGSVDNMTAYLNQQEGDDIKLAIYRDNGGGNFDFVGESVTWTKAGDGWHTFNMNGTVILYNGTYALAVWTDEPGGTNPGVTYDAAGGDHGEDTTVAAGNWPDYPVQLTESNTGTRRYSIYLNYTEVINTAPEPLTVTCPDVAKDVYEFLNVTVRDINGVPNIDYVDVKINTTDNIENFTFRWTEATNTFSLLSDPSNVTRLNTSTSTRTIINATEVLLRFNFTMIRGQQGNCDVFVNATDDNGLSGSDLFVSVFFFDFFNWNDEVYDLINSAFSQLGGIFGYIPQITTFLSEVGGQFTDSLIGLATMINLQFQIVWAVFGWFTTWATRMVTNVIAFGTAMKNIMNGISTGTTNLWTDFNFIAWGPDLIPIFLIVHWIETVNRRAKTQGLFTVLNGDLNAFANVFAFFMGVFATLVSFVEAKVNVLFQALNL